MFTEKDYDKLQQLMAESPENRALIQKLLSSHQETISTISHEIRNPLTLVYSTLQLIEMQHPEVKEYKYSLISSYETKIYDKIPDRNTNLTICANAINGYILPPDKIFSFNDIVACEIGNIYKVDTPTVISESKYVNRKAHIAVLSLKVDDTFNIIFG